jgi:predicted nucleic acid-binding Zn ribbon protein
MKCSVCNHQLNDGDQFCSKCGFKVDEKKQRTSEPGKKTGRRILIPALFLAQIGIFAFFFLGKGCSSVEGNLISKGEPVGDFTFVPHSCRSGQRMQFFGAVILGKGQQDGAIVLIEDPVKGRIVKIEVPGSCEPPDFEKCKEVIIDPAACSVYSMSVKRTSTMVNDIHLIDGSLKLNCLFREGGSVAADMVLKNCD